MSDLIRREDAIKVIKQVTIHSEDEDLAIEALENLPSAERKGKWIKAEKHYYKDDDNSFYYYEFRCSECGAIRKIGWAGANYCPNCGAMIVRGEEDE